MTKFYFSFLLLFSIFSIGNAQDTFSIVAVDSETGEIGAAGATCINNPSNIGGVILISGIIPGRGAINGQATICIPHVNLNIGMSQLAQGASPQEILDFLFQNDACQFGNENNRQYGVVDFDSIGMPRAAAFTGNQALDYAGHRVGGNYAIQGNILLGPEILDSMEARFLNTEGPLAKRIMAAMQGANVPGADSRCLEDSVSSTTTFLRVAKPDDEPDDFYLEINIIEAPFGVEPIDLLQTEFDNWCDTALVNNVIDDSRDIQVSVYPNPTDGEFYINVQNMEEGSSASFYNLSGQIILESPIQQGVNKIELPQSIGNQLVLMKMTNNRGEVIFTEKIQLSRE